MSDRPGVGVPTCYRHPDRETYISCQRCGKAICPDCMQDAAVGFQCPDCVREGRKETRSGLATYGGRRSADPQATSVALIVANVAVWVLVLATGGGTSRWVTWLALLPQGRCEAIDGQTWFPNATEATCPPERLGYEWLPGVADGSWWQLVTSMFTHVEVWHIGGNMLALWFLGPILEAVLGRTRFLALYFLSGLTGSAVVYALSSPQSYTLGASGAIFGLMGAMLVIAHRQRRELGQLGGLILMNGIITFVVPNVSWQGHLGGFVGGAAVAAILVYAPKAHRSAYQLAGLALLAVLIIGAIAARTATLV